MRYGFKVPNTLCLGPLDAASQVCDHASCIEACLDFPLLTVNSMKNEVRRMTHLTVNHQGWWKWFWRVTKLLFICWEPSSLLESSRSTGARWKGPSIRVSRLPRWAQDWRQESLPAGTLSAQWVFVAGTDSWSWLAPVVRCKETLCALLKLFLC